VGTHQILPPKGKRVKRAGVDIGGTFTDLVIYDEETGAISKTKTLTTHRASEEGLLRACREANVDFGQVSYFMHGTTLVTNLIITRSGAKVGLITTKGFRDVLEIGRSYRKELYNLQWDKPKPFVPRYLVHEVIERVDYKGNVLMPLDRAEVLSVVRKLLDLGVEAIAVCLFNSYANPEHERIVGQIIQEVAPRMYVSISSEVDPRIREYQRVSTTVLNAYAMPKTRGYIERLDKALGLSVKYMHSGGGIIPSSIASKFPITLVASGPAAGVLAGKFLGEKIGVGNLIAADVGGTSFDVCVIREGRPDAKDEVVVEWGIPARTQSIDVNSIGAGGGSIAWIDEGGALRVGPKSAGSDPGPACYNFGGTQPTVTDVNMVLGILNPDNFLGGRLKVAPQKARDAIAPIADHFKLSTEEAALGIYRIVNANMAQAILESTVKKGIDPRDFTLLSFGGAGGQHAIEVAREVGIPFVLLPINPSTFSAFGLLTADLKNTVSKTVLMPMDKLDIRELSQVFKELETEGKKFLAGEGKLITGVEIEHILDIRYIGQSNEVAVSLTKDLPVRKDAVYKKFEEAHHVLYGTQLGDPAEIVNVRVTVSGGVHPLVLQPPRSKPSRRRPVPRASRKVAFYDQPIPIYNRDELEYGMTIRDTCIIEEVDHTLFVPKGCTLRVDQYGNILVRLPEEKWTRERLEKIRGG
jgi:N-methylhydantoinase A